MESPKRSVCSLSGCGDTLGQIDDEIAARFMMTCPRCPALSAAVAARHQPLHVIEYFRRGMCHLIECVAHRRGADRADVEAELLALGQKIGIAGTKAT
jgi:hypothetical protein